MKTAFDYEVTQPYGYDPTYPLNNGNHTGVDYGCPAGTPIVVNGVQIGVSGATGAVYGAHLHVGHIVGGKTSPINPGDGRNVSGAKVMAIAEDNVNGKYVRIGDADGSNWVYLHQSNNNVLKVGDFLADQPQYEGVNVDELNQLRKELQQAREINALREDWLNKLSYALGDDIDAVEGDDIDRMLKRVDKLVKLEASKGTVLEPGDYIVK